MKISKLSLTRFTVFKEAHFEFSPGLNILIGANGTGKTHLMKLLHSSLSSVRLAEIESESGTQPQHPAELHLKKKLNGVFRPNEESVGRLISNVGTRSTAIVSLHDSGSGVLNFKLTTSDRLAVVQNTLCVEQQSIFIPSRETLAMFGAFTYADLSAVPWFDETYFDLCSALRHAALSGRRGKEAKALVESLETEVLGGKVRLINGRFHVNRGAGGIIEAPLLAEGWRKIASLVRLVVNGSLAKNGFLFWDEPEANLNPRLIRIVADMLRRLAASGIQVFVATHDYLLTHELSLAAEYPKQQPTELRCPMRFFALSHTPDGVIPQSGDILAALESNPILEEFSALYDRRCEMFSAPEPGRDA